MARPPRAPKRLSDITPQERKRLITGVLLRATATGTVLLGVYYLLPIDTTTDGNALLRIALGLVGFVALLGWNIKEITVSEFPQAQALRTLLGALPLFLVIFAGTYLAMSSARPEAFSEVLDHTDALYFTATVLSTVGFGDITAVSAAARLLVTAQMLLDLVLIAIVVRVVFSVTEKRLSRSGEPHSG